MIPIFANSATLTVPEHLVLGRGGSQPIHLGVRFGLWVHPRQGPILIDTGYGPEVIRGARSLALRAYAGVLKPHLEDQPEDVLQRLGFAANDVSTIFITHFHADHISGLKRFPMARFIAAGWAEIKAQSSWHRLRHGVFAELLPDDFEARLTPVESLPNVPLPFGTDRGDNLLGHDVLGHDVLGDGSMITLDLPGHAKGHTGLIWPDHKLIYAADAQWLKAAITEDRPPRGPARLIYEDETMMKASLERLRQAHDQGFEIMTCHDPID